MLIKIVNILLISSFSQLVFACGCGGPVNSIKVDVDSSDAIFIGIITEINKDHKFHLADHIGNGLEYINFDVYRSNKGLNKAQLKVSVFDYMSNSSCEGLTYGKQIGDTILVFATEFNNKMLGSYLCGRHPKTLNLTLEEQTFRDTANWFDPRTKYNNVDEYLSKQFPKSNQSTESAESVVEQKISWLYLSLAINLILIILILTKAKKKR